MNGTKLNKSCRDAWIICTLFRVKSWGEEIISANKVCLVPRFEDRLPLTHPFQRNALSKCEQATLFLAGPREPSLMYSFQYYLCGHQVRYEREKSVSSFFFLNSFYWFAVHFTYAPPPYFMSLKCSFSSFEAQTHINYNLNDKGSFIFIEFYASFNRNWCAFMHFISWLVWIHIGICFLIKFFFFFD